MEQFQKKKIIVMLKIMPTILLQARFSHNSSSKIEYQHIWEMHLVDMPAVLDLKKNLYTRYTMVYYTLTSITTLLFKDNYWITSEGLSSYIYNSHLPTRDRVSSRSGWLYQSALIHTPHNQTCLQFNKLKYFPGIVGYIS